MFVWGYYDRGSKEYIVNWGNVFRGIEEEKYLIDAIIKGGRILEIAVFKLERT